MQAQLTEEQARRLKLLAVEQGVSVAELLRRGAEHVLSQGAGDSPEARRARALSAVGRFREARDDTARQHDRALDEALGA